MDSMLQGISDWVRKRLRLFEKKLDPETLLRITGDASKVTAAFSKHGTRTLPASGEELDITLGKILKYLSDLTSVAFTGSYKSLSYRAIHLRARYYNYSDTVAYTTEILNSEAAGSLEKVWLAVGIGGSESTAGVSGATDFARAYLIVPKIEASSVEGYKGRSFILLQLGSSGSTARYTLTATAATDSSREHITLTIPKGSHAFVALYELPSSSSYVG